MKVKLEVIGVQPPCNRCKETEKNAQEAASRLSKEGVRVEISKLNVLDRETVSRFGVVRTPALAVNDTLKVAGRVPGPDQIEKLLREEVESWKKKLKEM